MGEGFLGLRRCLSAQAQPQRCISTVARRDRSEVRTWGLKPPNFRLVAGDAEFVGVAKGACGLGVGRFGGGGYLSA